MSFSSLRPSPITYSMALRRFGSSDRAGVALSRGRMAENEEEEWQGCEEITESLIPRRLVMLKFSSRLILSTISTSLSTWSPSSTCLSSRRLVSHYHDYSLVGSKPPPARRSLERWGCWTRSRRLSVSRRKRTPLAFLRPALLEDLTDGAILFYRPVSGRLLPPCDLRLVFSNSYMMSTRVFAVLHIPNV